MTDSDRKRLRVWNLAVFFVPVAVVIAFLSLYIGQQTTSIYGGDSGELVSAAYTWGIAHPPGYPLYTLLGAILSHVIPVGTIAWRMGFLSSIPMALSVYFVWLVVYRVTKSILASTLSSVFYGLLYPVWLYGITPEVFGMYAMFSALFTYLFIRWIDSQDMRTLTLLACFTGLAFTHHHLIILAVAAAGFTLFTYHKKTIIEVRSHAVRLIMFFALGFSFYAYAPIVSMFHPPFDREHAATLSGFLQLVTRASYGSFRASVGTGGILNGLADLTTFGQYVIHDITFVGIIFACAGLYCLWMRDKRIFSFIALYFLLLLTYFFYAGFPVAHNFLIGTLERFFIVPYQVIAILLGVGVVFFSNRLSSITHRVAPIIAFALTVLLPVGALRANYGQFAKLREDRTLERYAFDVNASVPYGSIYGAYEDSTASAMDFAYYVQSKRPDIIYLNYYLLGKEHYREQLHQRHPALRFPQWRVNMTIGDYITAFLTENSKKLSITSDISLPNIPGYFVPSGLVYIYYPTIEDIPDRSLILDKNDRLWKLFSDPLSGVLGTYKHLLLSDVLRVYADHALALAQAYALSGRYEKSKARVIYALDRETNVRPDVYSPIIDIFLAHGGCGVARDTVDRMHTSWGDDFVILELYHKIINTCKQNDPEINAVDARYKKLKPVYDTQIR